jgi:hypothetical protein
MMRKVKINKWKAKDQHGNEYDESLLVIFNVLINFKKPEEIPRGLDQFRLFNKLAKAFDKADESGELVLEETEYKFLKEMIEKNIPSNWGANDNITNAVESFLDAKLEE